MKRYIVEWRSCHQGEQYLFTQKTISPRVPAKPPAVLHRDDPTDPNVFPGQTIRPVIVGECDPDEGWTILYADQ